MCDDGAEVEVRSRHTRRGTVGVAAALAAAIGDMPNVWSRLGAPLPLPSLVPEPASVEPLWCEAAAEVAAEAAAAMGECKNE